MVVARQECEDSMGLKSRHPNYTAMQPNWQQMRDCYEGEKKIKLRGATYLPPTGGMVLDGMASVTDVGYKNYQSYKSRAVFPDYIREGVEALIGLLHQKDADIKLPTSMEYLRDNATIDGESLLMLLRKMNEEQLVSGRLGLLCDLPVAPLDPLQPNFFISMYVAESITNWDDGSGIPGANELNLVVLDESGPIRDGLSWSDKTQYRVLQLGQLDAIEETATYKVGVFRDVDYNETQMSVPIYRGASYNQIPFTFVNTKDINPHPDRPPLLGLSDTALSIYRGEADYRQNLHMQGQDTLVTIGGVKNPSAVPGDEDAVRVGAGSRLDVDIGGDAKFIGVSSTGLAEQRTALENDRKRAEFKAGQLIGNQSIKNESGNAMLARLAAQTANLNQIALSSGEGLQTALRHIAVWTGEDPESVVVTPNTEFTNAAQNAQELVHLLTARGLGAPLSMESIHAGMLERGFTKLSFEDEMKKVLAEGPNGSEKIAEETNEVTLEGQKLTAETAEKTAKATAAAAKAAASKPANQAPAAKK